MHPAAASQALIAAFLFAAAGPLAAASAEDDPYSPAMEQAAETAVAKLGANRARPIVSGARAVIGATREVQGLTSGIGGSARGVTASVKDLAAAMRDLGATESDIEVHIELPADVLFDVDKADIRPDAAKALAHLAIVIRSYTGPVRLIGHTDSDGSDAHNLGLSQRRAQSVQRWLVEKEALAAPRFATEGLGETKPVAANDTAENKQRNRRVEAIIRKK